MMTIRLTAEQEQIVRAEIDEGRFNSADEVVAYALATLHQHHGRHRRSRAPSLSWTGKGTTAA